MPIGEEVTVHTAVEITLENLWNPFYVSGPVSATSHSLAPVGGIAIADITNTLGLQPGWWSPSLLCAVPPAPPPIPDAQIWEVTAEFVFTNPVGYLWICPAISEQEITLEVTVTHVVQLSLCLYAYTADTEFTISVGPLYNAAGDETTYTVTLTLAQLAFTVGDTFLISGTYQGCLHKGTAGNNYIKHKILASFLEVDESDWYSLFWGGKALGYGDGNELYWKAISNFAGASDCADGTWECGAAPIHDPHLCRGPDGLLWLTYSTHEHVIKVKRRESPQREWVDVETPFGGYSPDVHHRHPCIIPQKDGHAMLCATVCDRFGRVEETTHFRHGRDYGQVWEPIANEAPFLADRKYSYMVGHPAGYLCGIGVSQIGAYHYVIVEWTDDYQTLTASAPPRIILWTTNAEPGLTTLATGQWGIGAGQGVFVISEDTDGREWAYRGGLLTGLLRPDVSNLTAYGTLRGVGVNAVNTLGGGCRSLWYEWADNRAAPNRREFTKSPGIWRLQMGNNAADQQAAIEELDTGELLVTYAEHPHAAITEYCRMFSLLSADGGEVWSLADWFSEIPEE